jgi:hypothetical protein
MAFTDQFVCPKVRFQFWNGKKIYTVMYSVALRTWYVFDEETEEYCLAKYEVGQTGENPIDLESASDYLNQYFESINSEYHTI